MVTRSGGRSSGSVTRVAPTPVDADRLSELAVGARALFNCANPPDYTQWATVWPPLADSLLVAAERIGAPLVTTVHLYPYGPVDEPMVEGQPDRATDEKGRLRAGMWAEALRRHEAGRIRAVEVRGSDYVGRRGGRQRPPVATRPDRPPRQGAPGWSGRPDLPHTWTDVARHGADAGGRRRAGGHLGPGLACTQQRAADATQGLTDVLAADGLPPVRCAASPIPCWPRWASSRR